MDLDWTRIARDLDERGCAVVPQLLDPTETSALLEAYADDSQFRSRVFMARHGFGRGEYKYLAYPLPAVVGRLRSELFPPLAEIANQWNARMGIEERFPGDHAAYIERCNAGGQMRPTPLILKYGAGDYNCLHQDLYGEHVFPLQLTVLLSSRETFEGGEIVLTEQRPRMQTRVDVVALDRGDAVIFAVNRRPVDGTRGTYRVTMRHGVSRIRTGNRYALGIPFHDAR